MRINLFQMFNLVLLLLASIYSCNKMTEATATNTTMALTVTTIYGCVIGMS